MKLIDCAGIAALLTLNEAHVRDRLTKRKDFPPAYRVGGVLRWKQDDIEDWLETRKVTPAARQSTRRARGNKPSPSQAKNAQPSAQDRMATESSPAA